MYFSLNFDNQNNLKKKKTLDDLSQDQCQHNLFFPYMQPFTMFLLIFHSYVGVNIDERLQILTFARHSWVMTIEQWGFFNVPHLMWHSSSVYNGNLRGPVTLTPIAQLLKVELSLPVFTTLLRLGFEHPTFRMRGNWLFIKVSGRIQHATFYLPVGWDPRGEITPRDLGHNVSPEKRTVDDPNGFWGPKKLWKMR